MVRRVALLGSALLALSVPAVATAKTTVSQPYAPFPTATANKKARSYYEHWHLKLSKTQLGRGVFEHPHAPGLESTTSMAASRRAGVGVGSLGVGPLAAVGVVALALATLAAYARRRPLRPRS